MRLLVVEDHAVVLDGLQLLLERRLPSVFVQGVRTFAEAVEAVAEEPFHLVLLDCYLPDSIGADSVTALKKLRPAMPIIMLTGELHEEERERTLAAGAAAYILKSTSAEELTQAIELGLQGKRVPSKAPGQLSVPGLTPRQVEVLRCVARGLTNKEIAKELGSAEATVRVHLTAILRVLKVTNRTEAALAARRLFS